MDPGTRVEWPSSFATWIGPFMVVPPVLALGGVLTLAFHRPDPYMLAFYGFAFLIAVLWAAWARRRPALVLDAQGIWQHNDHKPVPWSDAAMIWIGRSQLPGPFRDQGPFAFRPRNDQMGRGRR